MHWIYNDMLKLSFPVSEDLFWMYIGEGWRKGRVFNWSNYVSPEQKEYKRLSSEK